MLVSPLSSHLAGVRSFIDSLQNDVASYMPDCVLLSPPNMKGRLNDGVHLNQGGVARFLDFLQEHLVPRRPARFSSNSGRRSGSATYRDSLGTTGSGNFRVSQPASWVATHFSGGNSWGPSQPQRPQIDRNMLEEITAEVVNELSKNFIVSR